MLGALYLGFAFWVFAGERRQARARRAEDEAERAKWEWWDRLDPAERVRALAACEKAGEGLEGEAHALAKLEALRLWREEHLREKGGKSS